VETGSADQKKWDDGLSHEVGLLQLAILFCGAT
jgi:hypothetical protein